MSLHPASDSSVPYESAAVAHSAFPRGHAYLRLRDALGPIYTDIPFAGLFARVGQPAACPWRLALIALLQLAENLSDRRAADAVRARIKWRLDLLGKSGSSSFRVAAARVLHSWEKDGAWR